MIRTKEFVALLAAGLKISLRRGTSIYQPGQSVGNFYFIEKGIVTVSKAAYDQDEAKNVILAIHGPGDFFGEAALIPGSKYEEYAETETEIDTLTWNGKELWGQIQSDPNLAHILLKLVIEKRSERDLRIVNLVSGDAMTRLRLVLTDIGERLGEQEDEKIYLPNIRQETLGRLIGSTRETVTRCLRLLREEGFVRSSEGREHLMEIKVA